MFIRAAPRPLIIGLWGLLWKELKKKSHSEDPGGAFFCILGCRPGRSVSGSSRGRQAGVSVGSSCNQVTALALNLGNAATRSKTCGYFDDLKVMKSQQTQKAAKSYQLHTAYHCGGPLPAGARSTTGRLRLRCRRIFGGRVLNLIMEPFAEGDDPPDAHRPTIAVDQPIGAEDDLGQLAKPAPVGCRRLDRLRSRLRVPVWIE